MNTGEKPSVMEFQRREKSHLDGGNQEVWVKQQFVMGHKVCIGYGPVEIVGRRGGYFSKTH